MQKKPLKKKKKGMYSSSEAKNPLRLNPCQTRNYFCFFFLLSCGSQTDAAWHTHMHMYHVRQTE